MLSTSVPPKFPLAWAINAAAPYVHDIPVTSQIGITAGAASLNDGFVPLNATQIAAGGIPPSEQDMNGILRQITLQSQWDQAGGPIFFDSAFATAIGGYPKGATVASALIVGKMWTSTTENNTTDPDSTSSVGWVTPPGTAGAGALSPELSSTVPYGKVPANGLTIGNASSNATSRGNADTFPLYSYIWQNFSNTLCPIYTSAGVASTRGANPAADFNANKALATPNMKGKGIVGVDTMSGAASSFLAGVPIISGSTTIPGSIIGENLHALSIAELAAHQHAGQTSGIGSNLDHTHPIGTFAFNFTGGGGAQGLVPGGGSLSGSNNISMDHTHLFTTDSRGSGTGHNTVSLNVTVFWNLNL